MKKIIVSCALIGSLISANAQTSKTEEKIILQEYKPSSEIQIEIKEGNVYVDGKKVAAYAENKNLKIIKKFGKGNIEVPETEINNQTELFGMDNPETNKPLLGVSTQASKSNTGAEVKMVNANTPAAKAGLQEGDIITKINNTNITTPQDLVEAISSYKPGDLVVVVYNRNNKEISKQVKLATKTNEQMGQLFGEPNSEDMMGSLQEMMKQFGNGNSPIEGMEEIGGNGNMKFFGKGMKSKNPTLGMQVQERADNNGLLVTSVTENSAVAKAGIQPNDVVLSIDDKSMSSLEDMGNAVANADDKKEWQVEISRAGKKMKLSVKMEKQLRKKDF
jgi:serine protease Do